NVTGVQTCALPILVQATSLFYFALCNITHFLCFCQFPDKVKCCQKFLLQLAQQWFLHNELRLAHLSLKLQLLLGLGLEQILQMKKCIFPFLLEVFLKLLSFLLFHILQSLPLFLRLLKQPSPIHTASFHSFLRNAPALLKDKKAFAPVFHLHFESPRQNEG